MIALLLALASAADGDEVGGFVMAGQLDRTGLECQDDTCQKRGDVGGVTGTWSVKHCSGVITGASFSVTYVPDTGPARAHFQHFGQHVSDPAVQARALHADWVSTLTGAGWGLHTEETDADGTHWVRVVSAPHARLVRTTSRTIAGVKVYTTSLVASATDPVCPRP